MADLPSVLIIVAVLLGVTGLVQPLAQRLRLSHTVLLAAVGVLIGAGSAFLLATPLTNAFDVPAELILDFPATSQVFLFVFLPALLFQASLTLDVRRVAEDAAPILLLAMVAVVVTTGVVGLALEPLASVPLSVCLMLGAIVATTDPAAVVAIFRDIGAPARLTRLLEGESLLNDATAIAIFAVLLGYVTAAREPDAGAVLAGFARSFGGGLLAGFVAARIVAALLPLVRDIRSAQMTLTLALPYVTFVLCERYLGVSGVIACVTAGLVSGAMARSRIPPERWRFLQDVWQQLAFWASSLVFILAAILVPRLLTGVGWHEVGLVGVVVLASLIARAFVLFLLLPVLSGLKMAQAVSAPYKLVILWGGLRGAVTLALALSVTENRAIAPEVQRFIAVLATGYVLFTLLVNGTTLHPLIRKLGLDRLGPRDLALRHRVLAISLLSVRDAVIRIADAYHLPGTVAAEAAGPYGERIASAGTGADEDAITDRDRLNIGLVALAGRERDALLDHLHRNTASPHVLEAMLQHCDWIVEATRRGGRSEYNRAARRRLRFDRSFALATAIHRHLRIERVLANRLADRFETLLVSRMVLEDLQRFSTEKLGPVLGERLAGILGDVLEQRVEATNRALDALQLQVPALRDGAPAPLPALLCPPPGGNGVQDPARRRPHRPGAVPEPASGSVGRTPAGAAPPAARPPTGPAHDGRAVLAVHAPAGGAVGSDGRTPDASLHQARRAARYQGRAIGGYVLHHFGCRRDRQRHAQGEAGPGRFLRGDGAPGAAPVHGGRHGVVPWPAPGARNGGFPVAPEGDSRRGASDRAGCGPAPPHEPAGWHRPSEKHRSRRRSDPGLTSMADLLVPSPDGGDPGQRRDPG